MYVLYSRCRICRKEFEHQRRRAQYCSATCRKHASRLRQERTRLAERIVQINTILEAR